MFLVIHARLNLLITTFNLNVCINILENKFFLFLILFKRKMNATWYYIDLSLIYLPKIIYKLKNKIIYILR